MMETPNTLKDQKVVEFIEWRKANPPPALVQSKHLFQMLIDWIKKSDEVFMYLCIEPFTEDMLIKPEKPNQEEYLGGTVDDDKRTNYPDLVQFDKDLKIWNNWQSRINVNGYLFKDSGILYYKVHQNGQPHSNIRICKLSGLHAWNDACREISQKIEAEFT